MILEGGKTCQDFSVDAKSRHAIRNALLGLGYHLEDALPQRLQGAAFGLFYRFEVRVNFGCRHVEVLAERSEDCACYRERDDVLT